MVRSQRVNPHGGRKAWRNPHFITSVFLHKTPVELAMRKAQGAYTMNTVKIVCWEEDGAWLGYLQDYPDYWTHGDTRDDLKEHLMDLCRDITGNFIPGIRKVEELVVA